MAQAAANKGNENLPAVPNEAGQKPLTGAQRTAVLLLSLGEGYGKPIWENLDDQELAQVSVAMSTLGTIPTDAVEGLIGDFISEMGLSGAILGTFDSTERLLSQFLPNERVHLIMEEIRGPAGRNMWEKLSNVQANILANYLKNEYPQTIAVVLSKIAPDHAANVLSILPEELALEVVDRMLRMDSVQREILEKIEQTLRREFISNLAQTRQRDAHELMADIFNNFDRQTESRFISALEEENRESADRIKSLMFTFEDLMKLDPSSCQTLLRHVAKDVLALSMKGASEPVREFFYSNMTARASKMLQDEIEVMGPVRLKDVDEAQSAMINQAKELANSGDIIISLGGSSNDEFIE